MALAGDVKQSHTLAYLLNTKFVIPRKEESLRVSNECDSSCVGMINRDEYYGWLARASRSCLLRLTIVARTNGTLTRAAGTVLWEIPLKGFETFSGSAAIPLLWRGARRVGWFSGFVLRKMEVAVLKIATYFS